MVEIDSKTTLARHVERSFAAGHEIDLTGCIYGPATGASPQGYIEETMSYYRFLAGHCALTAASTVLEVGTHYGGSALALLLGMRAGGAPDPRVVTMDVTDLNRARIEAEPGIRKVIGDSTIRGFIASLLSDLAGREVDVLYIDALKEPGFVLRTMHNVHSVGLRPEWLILDDVSTNDRMRAFWALVEEEFPEASLLVSREFPQIRRPETGYAIVHLPGAPGLMSRCAEFMDRLGLDGGSLWAAEDTDRLAGAARAGMGEPYFTRARDPDFGEGQPAVLSRCYDLVRDTYRGRGDIVEFGAFAGATTRALVRGLADNEVVQTKIARITTIDEFRYTRAGEDRIVADRVYRGSSVLPLLVAAVEGHLEKVNIVDSALNIVRWSGRPIEFMVLANMRTPQIISNVVEQFLPHMPVGEGIIFHREYMLPYRPASSWIFAYLRDHFEVMQYASGMAVLKYVRPVEPAARRRIVENRFSPQERVALVDAQARAVEDATLAWDLSAQAVRLLVAQGAWDEAGERFESLSALAGGRPSPSRRRTLRSLAESLGSKNVAG